MVFPVAAFAFSSVTSLLGACGSWGYLKLKALDDQIDRISTSTRMLELSVDSAKKGSMWSELLKPLATEWAQPLKVMSYSLCAASAAFVLVGIGAWMELRSFRIEIHRLREENDALRRQLKAGKEESV